MRPVASAAFMHASRELSGHTMQCMAVTMIVHLRLARALDDVSERARACLQARPHRAHSCTHDSRKHLCPGPRCLKKRRRRRGRRRGREAGSGEPGRATFATAVCFPAGRPGAARLQGMVPRGLEPRTLRLLAVRSNQLSYETCWGIWHHGIVQTFEGPRMSRSHRPGLGRQWPS